MTASNTKPERPYPKYAIGRFSDLGNKWDSGFHLARIHLKDRVAQLEATISTEEAVRRLKALPAHARENMHVLTVGTRVGSGPSASQIDKAIRDYPHLALALVEPDMRRVAEQLIAEIDKRHEMLSTILNLTGPEAVDPRMEPFPKDSPSDDRMIGADASDVDNEPAPEETVNVTREGVAYPFKVAERYDDEDYGVGYGYAMVPEGSGEANYWLRDMWVVNERGDIHPGYADCPVPVRMEDLDLLEGVEIEIDLPKPKSMFDGPWGRP